jgi:hypothetical protein
VALLFNHDQVEVTMAKAPEAPRERWRELMEDFVGIDSNWRFLRQADVEWWRI